MSISIKFLLYVSKVDRINENQSSRAPDFAYITIYKQMEWKKSKDNTKK